MALEIMVTSDRKGSNPGGRCILPVYGRLTSAYIKYCNGASLPSGSSFVATHQPIYEAVTLALAERFGLRVPRYFLLQNLRHDVSFRHQSGLRPLASDKPYYLISELVELPAEEDLGALARVFREEKIFRDLLLISDVSGKQQNFAYFESPAPHVLYIDLGCSFVDSVEGMLKQRRQKRMPSSKKEARAILRKAEKHAIIAYGGSEMVELGQLSAIVDTVQIPTLNPSGRIPLRMLLSDAERQEIKDILLAHLPETLRRHQNSPYLVRNQ